MSDRILGDDLVAEGKDDFETLDAKVKAFHKFKEIQKYWSMPKQSWISRQWSKLTYFLAAFGDNINGLAQLGHIFVPFGIVVVLSTLAQFYRGLWWICFILSAIVVAFAYWKEKYRDTKPPENDPFVWWELKCGFLDFVMYIVGQICADAFVSTIIRYMHRISDQIIVIH